jgi:hypothetical protein
VHARFSFCAHPFVLEPAIKARVLHVDAMIEMQRQAEVPLSLSGRCSLWLISLFVCVCGSWRCCGR